MVSGKTEYEPQSANLKDLGPKDRKKRKSKKFRRLCWLAAVLALAIILLLSLSHRPSRYSPPQVTNERRVPTYLTHELGETINNGVQLGEPFDLVVTQKGINEVIAWYHKHEWSKQFGDLGYSTPEVFFDPNSITLMGAVAAAGREFVVTVVGKPALDRKGLLNLNVRKVKVGAVNITPVARIIAKTMYQKRLKTKPIDKDDVRTKIAASLLNNEPFDPVFRVKDAFERRYRRVRLKEVTLRREELILHLAPLPN
jgi:uncharacterized protein YpmS